MNDIVDNLLELKKELEEIAKEKQWTDAEDFCPMEYSGSNFSDCYDGGKRDGRISLARELLQKLGGDNE